MTETALRHGTPEFEAALGERFDRDVAEVVRLSAQLCAVPGITVPASATDFGALGRTAKLAARYARAAGLRVIELEPEPGAPYPLLAVGFQDNDPDDPELGELVALIGHIDVVPPREEGQFEPRLEGVDLYARGAADMKTVVATWLVWMARRQAGKGSKPPVMALLSCCEENGSAAPHHTGTMLDLLRDEHGVEVRFALVGERTGELEWMKPEPVVGPICKENRSWRWIRAESDPARGMEALRRAAAAVGTGRQTIADLNAFAVPAEKADRQPGVRSGFVNPFVRVAADEGLAEEPWALGAVRVEAGRSPGAAIHSAAAKAGEPSLLERQRDVARLAVEAFGDRVRLVGVEIGADGNFNSYDGSGWMRLRVDGVGVDAVRGWAEALVEPGIEVRVDEHKAALTRGPTYLGIDIRELLDHRDAVGDLIDGLRGTLWDGARFEMVSARPSWRCPAEHPDLVKLEQAYAEVVGAPSPDLVKLHGNDGGSLAERQQASDIGAAMDAVGHAVVFGQVGKRPHGAGEFHRCSSIRPYWDILDRWADAL